MAHHLLSVVMPAHNERATLRTAVERLLKTDLPIEVELIVVDDGSSDGCAETISDLADGRGVRLIRSLVQRGKGVAVRVGLEAATGEIIAILDADLEYDPADLEPMVQAIVAGEARVVYGTRNFGAHTAFSFWYVVGNKFINLAASILFNTWLSDISTCLKMAETRVWRSIRLYSTGFEFDAEATARFLKSGERIYEVPVSYRARSRADGKKVRSIDGLRHLWALVTVRFE